MSNKILFFSLFMGICQLANAQFSEQWTYEQITNPNGTVNSNSQALILESASNLGANLQWQCSEGQYLSLNIETVNFDTKQHIPIKTKYVSSGFVGSFQEATIKVHGNSIHALLQAHRDGAGPAMTINLDQNDHQMMSVFSSPNLRLNIPTEPKIGIITLKLDHPNIRKVFKDCSFIPTSVKPKKSKS
jgi:hypothetical protein